RKKLYLITLFVFLIGNVLTYFSPTFSFVMIARVITSMSAALATVLSLTIAAKIVQPEHRAKALGLIYMGVSSSLVLGVPIGIIITDAVWWRSSFLGLLFSRSSPSSLFIYLSSAFLLRMLNRYLNRLKL